LGLSGRRKQGSEEKYIMRILYDLHCSSNIVHMIKSRRMRWERHVAHMGERRGLHRLLVWNPEGRTLLGRPRLRWEDNITMDLRKWDVGHGLD
jgi:hypothetical protein